MKPLLYSVALLTALVACDAARRAPADEPANKPVEHSAESLEFFEKQIRPLLAKHCFDCHGAKKEHNGLRLDSRAAMLKGGDDGPAITVGRPEKSLLIAAVKHESFEMPPEPAAKLSADEIASLEKWITLGAPWPTTPADLAAQPKTIAERARAFWAFQPVKDSQPPKSKHEVWSQHTIDRFIAAKWDAANLAPTADADPQTLIRRVTYVLTGLPPTPEEVEAFARECAAGKQEVAYLAVVDRLLASARFGEHWARHWMDWVRYCESHGSEGDPPIPDAWRYRDYLIRALNADVPYDQLLREHLAGDLLPQPRINTTLGINESKLGPAHLRMVEHCFQPLDPFDDLVKFTDNQIDVVMKSFQALTVTCARCHDHKFDAISQADFYGLYPLFAASRPGQVQVDLPERLHKHDVRMRKLKTKLKPLVADAWLASLDELPARLAALPQPTPPPLPLKPGEKPAEPPADPLQRLVDDASKRFDHVLNPWLDLRKAAPAGSADPKAWNDAWKRVTSKIGTEQKFRNEQRANETVRWLTLDEPSYAAWSKTGAGAPSKAFAPGMFTIAPEGDALVQGVYPRGVYTHELSTKHGAILSSPKFKLEGDAIGVRVVGGRFAQVRLVVDNYPLSRGGIYGQTNLPHTEAPQWVHWDTTYWKGFHAYVEIETFDDANFYARAGAPNNAQPPTDGRSFIGITDIVERKSRGFSDVLDTRLAAAAFTAEPALKSLDELAARYQTAARAAVEAWRSDKATDAQVELLNILLQAKLLPNERVSSTTVRSTEVPSTVVASDSVPSTPVLRTSYFRTYLPPTAVALIDEYRKLEAEIPKAQRAPGVIESVGFDQQLMTRGDHRKLAEVIPRRYLEGLGSKSLAAPGSGRLQLAEQLASSENPLTARVAVNRLWHYTFGRGIVATVDNFGQLGTTATHPELLDHLAARFVREGWSLKQALRYMVTSRTFRLSSTPTAAAKKHDPTNLWLSHARVRRLDAEAIRDTLLADAGLLREPGDEGPGLNHNEPTAKQTRRSVYTAIKRNSLPPFLETFDAPKPFTTLGVRDVTNTPGQALTLLNDGFVIEAANFWGKTYLSPPKPNTASVPDKDPSRTDVEARIRRMYLTAFARTPTDVELSAAIGFVAELGELHKVPPADRLKHGRIWQDFAHALVNMKEFIYVR
jgi:mono/diheme cytochrome c family protein